jgi:hypothetical protein
MFTPAGGTLAYSSFYGGGANTTQAPTQQASGGASPAATGANGSDSAHIAWLGIVGALIIVRVMYELGAREI